MTASRKLCNALHAIVAVTLSMTLSACDLVGPNRREFVVQIDSLSGPTAVSGGAAFEQFLFGGLGPDGCYHLKAVLLTQSTTNADITVVGEHTSGGSVMCPASPVGLEGRPVKFTPPVTDPFTIRVHQPNGAVLTRIIRVE